MNGKVIKNIEFYKIRKNSCKLKVLLIDINYDSGVNSIGNDDQLKSLISQSLIIDHLLLILHLV